LGAGDDDGNSISSDNDDDDDDDDDNDNDVDPVIKLLALLYSSVKTFVSCVAGAFSEWLSEHPDVIGLVLPLLLKGLQDRSLAQSASMSLKDLVRECQLHLQPYASDILIAAKV